jgi:Zn-dependent peptidase ImmA (M78 family)
MMRAQSKIYDHARSEHEAVEDALFEEVADPIARRFGVSASAMRIRLENLNLLLRETPPQRLPVDL